jgi:hypothetical protein
MFVAMTPSYGLMEEKNGKKINSLFMIQPGSFSHVNENLNTISILYKMAELPSKRDTSIHNMIFSLHSKLRNNG